MSKQDTSKRYQLGVNAKSFDYATLDRETQAVVKQKAIAIKDLFRKTAQNLITIGQNLHEVQQELGYGKFRRWLKSEFNWSVSTATKLMQVAEKFKSVNFTDLNFGCSALYLLAAPSTPEAAREEALNMAEKGTSISYSLAKRIVSQHKQSLSLQKNGLDRKVEVEAEIENLEQIPVNGPLDQPETQETLEKPPNLATFLLHGSNKLTVNQDLQPGSDLVPDICEEENELTQMSDLKTFKQYLGREWKRLKREKSFLSLILCSVDDFWLFNPESSHVEEGSCLMKVLQVLESNVKRPADLITYVGEEQFIIALPNTNPDGAKQVAEAIAANVRQLRIPYPLLSGNRHITVSLGIAGAVPRTELSLDMLVTATEKAVLIAQKQGGNRALISNLELEELTGVTEASSVSGLVKNR